MDGILRAIKKIGIGLSVAVGASLLNLLVVVGVCWLRGYRNPLAYSNGLFYTGFVYIFVSVVMMVTVCHFVGIWSAGIWSVIRGMKVSLRSEKVYKAPLAASIFWRSSWSRG